MTGDNENDTAAQSGDEANTDATIDDTSVAVKNVDNVGDMSVEINVEELVARIESDDTGETDKDRDLRKKLDDIKARKDDELDSTYNFNLDDDL